MQKNAGGDKEKPREHGFLKNYNKNINIETETLREGGSHWSVLLYNKKENKFFHHDSIANTNKDHAVTMAKKIKSINKEINSTVIEIPSPQQNNGYDCGIYALLYIKKNSSENSRWNIS